MKDTEGALKWIVSILRKHDIRFLVSGGFAANIYGSSRELADIDIDVEIDHFDKIFPEVNEYLVYGPSRYKDANWNLMLMTIEYKGQHIDIASDAAIFDKTINQWVQLDVSFECYNNVTIYGVEIPVIKKYALIAYKNKLCRNVDRIDVKALKNNKSL